MCTFRRSDNIEPQSSDWAKKSLWIFGEEMSHSREDYGFGNDFRSLVLGYELRYHSNGDLFGPRRQHGEIEIM